MASAPLLTADSTRSHLVCLRCESASWNNLDRSILSSKAVQNPVGGTGNTKVCQQCFCSTLVHASSTSAQPSQSRQFLHILRQSSCGKAPASARLNATLLLPRLLLILLLLLRLLLVDHSAHAAAACGGAPASARLAPGRSPRSRCCCLWGGRCSMPPFGISLFSCAA